MWSFLKKRGFYLEDKHLVHISRIEKLIYVLTAAFSGATFLGESKEEAPIEQKFHGRKAKSIFRYRFDELQGVFLNLRKNRIISKVT